MSIIGLQTALLAIGLKPGPVDGALGAKTMTALLDYMTTALVPVGLAEALAKDLPPRGINNRLRWVHFLAQAAHETGGFRYLVELGGPTYFAKYDGRKDLGNMAPGDGARYRGRGIFQLTGRANYRTYGEALGLPLDDQPDLASKPDVAVKVAGLYWERRNLSLAADRDDLNAITKAINGGTNGLADRANYLTKLKEVWP
jgi:putative chitinase